MYLFLMFILFPGQPGSSVIVDSYLHAFTNAVSFTLTSDERILVLDQGESSIVVVQNNNTIQRTVGSQGWDTESFDHPTNINSTFPLDIFISDRNNERIQQFDKNLNFVRSIDRTSAGIDGSFRPIACVQSAQGELFILDTDGKRMIRTDQRGILSGEYGMLGSKNITLLEPKDIALSGNEEVYILDRSEIHISDKYGNFINTIALNEKQVWNSISLHNNILLIISPTEIQLHNLISGEVRSVFPNSIIGSVITEPFSDALLDGDRLFILTPSTLYRCSFP